MVEKEKIEKEKEMEKKEKRDYSVYFMVTEKKKNVSMNYYFLTLLK